MECRMHWADRPLWVRIGLFGVPSRKAAMLWMKGSLAAVVAVLGIQVAASVFMSGLGMSVALAALLDLLMLNGPLWYWLAIRWTDEHEGWALHTWKS
jgi:hypothetical protein